MYCAKMFINISKALIYMNNYTNSIKALERKLISDTRKLDEIKKLIESFQEYEKLVASLKGDIKVKKSNEALIEDTTAKTKILEPLNKFYNAYCDSFSAVTNEKTVKTMYDFFEKFRTYRKYYLNEFILERFISGFLNNFAEEFTFKTEFIGQINLVDFSKLVEGTKEGSVMKITYNKIPKTIKEAYKLKLKKFIIESHNLKLLFRENYLLEVYANSNMISKIDKLAKENNLKLE